MPCSGHGDSGPPEDPDRAGLGAAQRNVAQPEGRLRAPYAPADVSGHRGAIASNGDPAGGRAHRAVPAIRRPRQLRPLRYAGQKPTGIVPARLRVRREPSAARVPPSTRPRIVPRHPPWTRPVSSHPPARSRKLEHAALARDRRFETPAVQELLAVRVGETDPTPVEGALANRYGARSTTPPSRSGRARPTTGRGCPRARCRRSPVGPDTHRCGHRTDPVPAPTQLTASGAFGSGPLYRRPESALIQPRTAASAWRKEDFGGGHDRARGRARAGAGNSRFGRIRPVTGWATGHPVRSGGPGTCRPRQPVPRTGKDSGRSAACASTSIIVALTPTSSRVRQLS